MELWHKKLGHVSYKLLHNLEIKEIVREIPMFKKECKLVCGNRHIGIPTRVKHTHIDDVTTTHVLELLHIDLLGPTWIESIGGKKYPLVCKDDFSR